MGRVGFYFCLWLWFLFIAGFYVLLARLLLWLVGVEVNTAVHLPILAYLLALLVVRIAKDDKRDQA